MKPVGYHAWADPDTLVLFVRHPYAVPLTGGPLARLTTTPGAHLTEVSPDEATLADVFSTGGRPPEVHLGPNRPGAGLRQVTTPPGRPFGPTTGSSHRSWPSPPAMA